MKLVKSIMIQGTASSCGKSLLTAALCRILRRDGYRVAPFKAQNMSNNSFVTREGLEMGRAQAVQAYAAGLEPDVRMNPVLLKPSSDTGSQVVLRGKAAFTMNANEWHETRDRLRGAVRECYESLAALYDVIVIEGAGSPAEINLKQNDIVNMGMAAMAGAPVLIVGDIDRGGVFASLAGTMLLFDEAERARVKGFIINKFRGDLELLKPGLDRLERMTGVPVLGVVPWITHAIDDEDGATERLFSRHAPSEIDICVIRLPHISNFTDFIPLEAVPGVGVRWCETADGIGSPDLLMLPGTKATIADLRTIKQAGIGDAILAFTRRGGTVLGICGGFQMLGKTVIDTLGAESATAREEGLGLLDMVTTFGAGKTTVQVTATVNGKGSWLLSGIDGETANGYEIHMGQSDFGPASRPVIEARDRDGSPRSIGIADASGRILGTYLHGLFDSGRIAAGIINALRRREKLAKLDTAVVDRRFTLERDLEPHRQWVEKVCGESGIVPHLPLWKGNRRELAREFIDAGFKAIVVVVNTDMMPCRFLGRAIDSELIRELEECGVDACGENGEFHTFVYDGPLFNHALNITENDKISRDGYSFLSISVSGAAEEERR